MPGRAEALAQRGELTGYRTAGGDRARFREHGEDLARHGALDRPAGVSAGQDAFGLEYEQAFGETDRRPFGRWGRGLVTGRCRGADGKLDETGPVADQVEPPDTGRGHGRQPGDAEPGGGPAHTALEPDGVASPLFVHRPELVVRQVVRPGAGALQLRARSVRWPVHAHDDGDHGLGSRPHQRHEVQRPRRAAADHPNARPMGAACIAWLAPGDGRLAGGSKKMRCKTGRCQFSRSRDRTSIAA